MAFVIAKPRGDSVECQYNFAIKYELYKSRKKGGAQPGRSEGAAPRFLGLAQSPRRSGRAAVSQASPLHGLGPMDADFGKRCWPAEWQWAGDLSKKSINLIELYGLY